MTFRMEENNGKAKQLTNYSSPEYISSSYSSIVGKKKKKNSPIKKWAKELIVISPKKTYRLPTDT